MFLLADKNIDVQRYNGTKTDVTWETCTMRSWLNGYGAEVNSSGEDYRDNNFLNNAFTEGEQSTIKTTNVVKNDNSYYGREGGNDTSDQVYLLSLDEVMNPAYGFTSYTKSTTTREAVNTAYVAEGGEINSSSTMDSDGSGMWWLRSPSYYGSYYAAIVGGTGGVGDAYAVFYNDRIAVRPALHLNLKASSDAISTPSWSYAGTVTSDDKVEWDCVWFGNYWQEDRNGDGKADQNDAKQPIKWRVLSVDGNDAFLVADKNLDCQEYNDTDTSVTWETCTLRSWLNGYGAGSNKEGKDYSSNNFLINAFAAGERPAIKTTNVVNDDNPYYGTEGGNDTSDKVYLLSLDEVKNPSYGFSSDYNKPNESRRAKNTGYAKDQGVYTVTFGEYAGNGSWWLRSPGRRHAANVHSYGFVYRGGLSINDHDVAVRPALHLNLSSTSSWSYAGTVTSEGGGSAISPPEPGASVTPTPLSHTHAYGTDWKSDMTTHWKECSCGEKTENAAHTEDAGTVTKEATETETGIRTYKCVVCGYVTRTEEIAVLPPSHTHAYGTDWKSDMTTHWKECSCGEKTENAAHTEDAGTVTKEATETETGIRTYKCVVCGYVTRTEEIAVLPPSHTHAYGTDWKSSATTHWKECSCGDKKDETVHTEDAGTITKEPTKTETGVRTYKCSVCGYVTKTEEIEKHGEGLFGKGDETTSEVETPPEATDIPEDDRITSITINPAFNMKHKDGNEVELDLSKIKIKAKEIYDEAGLKRAEAALGETLNGNKHYNLLDLTLLYDGKDFSNSYDGLVKVIIPIPKGHRDKTFSCYRITEKDGKMTKELISGQQTEDSYIIYLEHFSEYALVAAEPEEPHAHVYSTDWKSDATGHWKECACKNRAEESVHFEDAGTVTKEATETKTGIRTYKCSVCGYVIKTEVIAKLQKGTTNKQSSTATKVTKAQKYKNGIMISKKISFTLTGNSLAVAWNKLPDVDGYDIFAASCDDAFKGITISVKKNNSSAIIRKINGRKIDGKKTYKVKVKAYRFLSNGKKQYIGTSAVMHVTGSLNKTRTNVKKISLKKKVYVLKRGKTTQIRTTIIKMDRKKKLLSKTHGPKLSYVSSDRAIATVTATGKIKAKKTGKCTIYVRALNGVSKKIKVSVK